MWKGKHQLRILYPVKIAFASECGIEIQERPQQREPVALKRPALEATLKGVLQ